MISLGLSFLNIKLEKLHLMKKKSPFRNAMMTDIRCSKNFKQCSFFSKHEGYHDPKHLHFSNSPRNQNEATQ